MLDFIKLMEDLASLNSQIKQYKDYEKTHNFVNSQFSTRIAQMEKRRNQLQHDLEIMYMSI
ncbi:MAG: hypothetical protein K6F15_06810 [Treponema sp.]|nr:hypothetical protein [Treponema sp.]